jgi:hypothetical protein
VVLLLVSARFLASEYIRGVEVKRAVERARAEQCILIPIILEEVDWTGENFGVFNALPSKGKPIQSFKPRNNGWYQVGLGLRTVLEGLRQRRRQAFSSHGAESLRADAGVSVTGMQRRGPGGGT